MQIGPHWWVTFWLKMIQMRFGRGHVFISRAEQSRAEPDWLIAWLIDRVIGLVDAALGTIDVFEVIRCLIDWLTDWLSWSLWRRCGVWTVWWRVWTDWCRVVTDWFRVRLMPRLIDADWCRVVTVWLMPRCDRLMPRLTDGLPSTWSVVRLIYAFTDWRRGLVIVRFTDRLRSTVWESARQPLPSSGFRCGVLMCCFDAPSSHISQPASQPTNHAAQQWASQPANQPLSHSCNFSLHHFLLATLALANLVLANLALANIPLSNLALANLAVAHSILANLA